MKVRRVVTGHTPEGKATFVSDSEVEGLTVTLNPGAEFHRLWGGDEAPTFPDDGSSHDGQQYFPPVGGYRFGMFTVPPHFEALPADFDFAKGLAEVEEKLPGIAAHMEPDSPGMHTTDTIDFEYVISGEVWLELDDGKEVHLRAGDTVVQNGTRHAWHNKSDEPCQLVVFIAGAHRSG